ncbi:uncharacterized protein PRCAT00000398001 [Priceomyces carsonii]|uniref:uncharacterized protein n=1 Tax=Priceomyces carsonii TaxID=28549 RepID=UPI002ED96A20|nr:unnamed protein product [Priceomyces carsonii]
MDVFNSALRNPVPPIKKETDDGDSPSEDLAHQSSDSSRGDSLRKKRNSRRKHRNSHLGCGTCKKRRIKCDENLPSCLNCFKGKLHCAYLNLDGPARNALRMAQYNQNLRQDKLEVERPQRSRSITSAPIENANNVSGTSDSSIANYSHHMIPDVSIPRPVSSAGVPGDPLIQTYGHTIGAPHQYPNGQPAFAVPYPIVQSQLQVQSHQQAQVIQSPYGPIIQLQPLTAVPTYPVPVPQSIPLVYSSAPSHIGPVPSVSHTPYHSTSQGHTPHIQHSHIPEIKSEVSVRIPAAKLDHRTLTPPPLGTEKLVAISNSHGNSQHSLTLTPEGDMHSRRKMNFTKETKYVDKDNYSSQSKRKTGTSPKVPSPNSNSSTRCASRHTTIDDNEDLGASRDNIPRISKLLS